MKPYEIISAPFEIWVAPEGEAFPAIGAEPSGNWRLLGTSGKKSMHGDGITVNHEQTIERDAFRTMGTTGALKAARTSEDLSLEFTLMDLSLEEYSYCLGVGEYEDGGGDVVDDTGGVRSMGLYRGLELNEISLLARGPSPYAAGLNCQYELKRCYIEGNPAPVFRKGGAAGLLFRIVALVSDLTGSEGESQRFGRFIAGHDSPDINLTSLTENLTADFDPAIVRGTYAYDLAATNPEDSVILVATLVGATITYDPDGDADVVVSGVGYEVALEVGANTVEIDVEKTGYTTKRYTLTITRAAA